MLEKSSTNLADLFLQLWLILEGKKKEFEEALRWQRGNEEQTLRTADFLDTLLRGNHPRLIAVLYSWLLEADLGGPQDGLQRIVVMAQAIDRWHQPLSSPNRPPASHRDAHRQLMREGRLNTSHPNFSVILRRPLWGRYSDPNFELPRRARESWTTFNTLFVVRAQIDASDPDDQRKVRSITFSYRILDPTDLRMPKRADEWKPKIGFAPIAEQADEIDLRVFHDPDGHWYDTETHDLGSRAAKAIETLCKQGAEIIVFPEMALHTNALVAVRQAVRNFGPTSNLMLVIAGTWRSPNGPSKPYNEAVILNHRGEDLGRQRKLHRWNLQQSHCDRYALQLPIALPANGEMREFITPGDEVLVLESTFGRLAIMICEDLGRSEPGKWLRDNMLLDWVFTPLLDSSMDEKRWMAQRGGLAAFGGRCRVVVANSVPLTLRQNEVNKKTSPHKVLNSVGIGLCLDIRGGRTRYRLESHNLTAPSAASYLVDWDPQQWKDFPFDPATFST